MQLKPGHEIVGNVDAVRNDGGMVKVVFTVHKEVELPYDALAEKDLQSIVGERVGIFNSGEGYKLRKIKTRG